MANTSRRTFLGGSVAGTALGLSALTYRGAGQKPDERVHLALIGLGAHGQYLSSVLDKFKEGCQVDVLCDVDELRFAAVAKQHEKAERVKDLRQVMEKRGLDAVVIATPTHWNALATIMACNSGKDVYVEAPFTHNIRETRAVEEAVLKNKRIVQIGTQFRSHPHWNRLTEEVGKIGNVSIVQILMQLPKERPSRTLDSEPPKSLDFNLWLGPAPECKFNSSRHRGFWSWYWNYGSGVLGSHGIHLLDMALGLTRLPYPPKEPIQVGSKGGMFSEEGAGETPDTQVATFTWNKTAILWEHRAWKTGMRAAREFTMTFHGSKETLVVDQQGWYREKGLLPDPDPENKPTIEETPDRTKLEGLFQPDLHLKNFLDCVRTRKPPTAEVTALVPAMTLCHLGNIAFREGTSKGDQFETRESRFKDNSKANLLLSREYRKGFELR